MFLTLRFQASTSFAKLFFFLREYDSNSMGQSKNKSDLISRISSLRNVPGDTDCWGHRLPGAPTDCCWVACILFVLTDLPGCFAVVSSTLNSGFLRGQCRLSWLHCWIQKVSLFFVSYKAWAQGIAHKEMKKSKQVPHSLEQAVLGFEPRQSGVSVYILHR